MSPAANGTAPQTKSDARCVFFRACTHKLVLCQSDI